MYGISFVGEFFCWINDGFSDFKRRFDEENLFIFRSHFATKENKNKLCPFLAAST
jgi:hypothetical protein